MDIGTISLGLFTLIMLGCCYMMMRMMMGKGSARDEDDAASPTRPHAVGDEDEPPSAERPRRGHD